MPTPTYDLIASNVLSSSASSVTFSSIPATYRDLIISVFSANNQFLEIRMNSDTGNNYSRVGAEGTGSTTASYSGTFDRMYIGSNVATSSAIINVMDYSATDKHKTVLARHGSASSGSDMSAHRWANTAAINTIQISASFAAGSTFYLYGIVS